MDVITITTDDIEKEPVTLNSVSQGKATRKSIPREKILHSHTGPELGDGEVNVNTDTNEPAWFSNHPDGRNSAETDDMKEITDDTFEHVRPEDGHKKFTESELEIRFGIDDFRANYDRNKDVIYKFNELTKTVFQVILLPKGKGLHSVCQTDQDKQPEHDINMYAHDDNPE